MWASHEKSSKEKFILVIKGGDSLNEKSNADKVTNYKQ